MCGIVGLVARDGKTVDSQELLRLNQLLFHRGPDDDGFLVDGPVGLAMRRLAIIDLSSGHQPMFSEDGRYAIVFNGEIYNFHELRKELEQFGLVFHTQSDTEVVLRGYAEMGPRFLERLNGMFGLAIYDKIGRKLFLARDRLGEKQIYYRVTPQTFVFGSEMKIPMALRGVPRNARLSSVAEFLAYQYVGGTDTIVEGIELLPEGHYLTWDLAQNSFSVRPYWRLENLSTGEKRQELRSASERVYEQLKESIRQRLVADVPVTVMLSSGLDSGAISYVLAQELKTNLHCFTLGFTDRDFDESEDAKVLVDHFHLEWTRVMTDGQAIAEDFPRFIDHIDSLQANTAQLLYFTLTRAIRKAGYKVSLNGNGGDELFAGYPTYRATRVYRWYRRLPAIIRRAIRRRIEQLPPKFGRVSTEYKLKQFASCEAQNEETAHGYWRTVFSEPHLQLLHTHSCPELKSPVGIAYDRAWKRIDEAHVLGFKKFLVADFLAWLIPMLPWADNMSMANSIELRLPFLDHHLVELVLSLPDDLLFSGWKLKKVMKTFLAGRIPEEILYRPKRGTHVPLSRWLNREFKAIADHYLSDAVLNRHEVFNMPYVRSLLKAHRDEVADHTFRLWTLIVFSAWVERNKIDSLN